MFNRVRLAIADDDIRVSGKNGRNEVADARLRVLVVAVRIDHDVRAVRHRIVDAVAE